MDVSAIREKGERGGRRSLTVVITALSPISCGVRLMGCSLQTCLLLYVYVFCSLADHTFAEE